MQLLRAVAVVLLLASSVSADDAPWAARRRPGITPDRTEHVTPEEWPAEPASPGGVDAERLAGAFRQLCGRLSPARGAEYAGHIVAAAREFDEDPFLLGAMAFQLGHCRQRTEELGGSGLTLIPRDMYLPFVDGGTYRYQVRDRGLWVERRVALDRYPFAGPRLRRAAENLYFAAGLLSTWRAQHESVDGAFEQVPHRHYVSHFVWGDRVRSHRDEDRILAHRRRLLQYYGAYRPPETVERLGRELGSPLDGAPRAVFGYIGDARDGGDRRHRGTDVESMPDEPVRAIADGVVTFAGVDYPGRHTNENMTWAEIRAIPRDALGRGGRYVCITHGELRSDDWLRSCYMHLEEVSMRWGATVRRGDRVGTVGRTGMNGSAAHLHLELHTPGNRLLDASEVLNPLLLGQRR